MLKFKTRSLLHLATPMNGVYAFAAIACFRRRQSMLKTKML